MLNNRPDLHRFILPQIDTSVTGRELFAWILFEEAQHMFAKAVPHGTLKSPDDFGRLIEHPDHWTNTFGSLTDYLQAPDRIIKRLDIVRTTGNGSPRFSEISELDPEYTEAGSRWSFNTPHSPDTALNIVSPNKESGASTTRAESPVEAEPLYRGVAEDFINDVLEASLADKARFVLPGLIEGAEQFVSAARNANTPLLCVLDSALPKTARAIITEHIRAAGIKGLRVMTEEELAVSASVKEYAGTFIIYIGTTPAEIDAAIRRHTHKAVFLMGSSPAAIALSSIHTTFIRLFIMARSIQANGQIAPPSRYFDITDVFAGFATLPADMTARLNDVHTLLESRVVELSA
jgi:hypothetical protein